MGGIACGQYSQGLHGSWEKAPLTAQMPDVPSKVLQRESIRKVTAVPTRPEGLRVAQIFSVALFALRRQTSGQASEWGGSGAARQPAGQMPMGSPPFPELPFRVRHGKVMVPVSKCLRCRNWARRIDKRAGKYFIGRGKREPARPPNPVDGNVLHAPRGEGTRSRFRPTCVPQVSSSARRNTWLRYSNINLALIPLIKCTRIHYIIAAHSVCTFTIGRELHGCGAPQCRPLTWCSAQSTTTLKWREKKNPGAKSRTRLAGPGSDTHRTVR